MSKLVQTLIVGLLAMILLASPVLAQGPITPQHSDPFWQAAYWNNMTLSGAPAVQRPDPNLDFNWGAGSPDPSIPADRFSARWTRYIEVAAGVWRFTSISDDGMRVYVDNELIIDEWNDHSFRMISATRNLAAGHHLLVVDFYENAGGAVAKLTWAPVGSAEAWRGEYYANPWLSGQPVIVHDDPQIDFNWGTDSPFPYAFGGDQFSVRWTRTVNLPAGSYRFSATADDGVRLWVNEHLLIDAWRDQAATTYNGDIYLPGGPTALRVEYYENAGLAVARLSWSIGGGTPAGAVVVEDTDAGFARGGLASSWRTAAEGSAGRLLWTRNDDYNRPGYNWGNWYPRLAAGRYEVFVYIPERYTTTRNARYWVSHAGGYTQRIVNQSANPGRWVSLGTYWFRGTDQDYLSLSDVTYEAYLSQIIAWDAAKWEPR